MLPARQQKVDVTKMTEEEKKMFRLYGKLPSRKDILNHKVKERKYFDSGDYALSKAGKNTLPVGEQHPSPDNIPHQNPALMPTCTQAEKLASSPVKDTSLPREPLSPGSLVSSNRLTPAPVTSLPLSATNPEAEFKSPVGAAQPLPLSTQGKGPQM
ncbi:hypothetical protein IWQ60_011236 [Tieghemiomyces parasiticus]|uniref:mRNA stability protein n=1 Tax=Tieghemiomyces parasiticus TaxID=78921 RepID=A0A9W7ZJT7_9FUNG|nr:hypothetical protein IWQ60_011236 [Tieghemiomyces parasiticus]